MDLPSGGNDGKHGASSASASQAQESESTANWTYPTRMCRICYEDVVPTVTMYPPGLPPSLQRPHVEYISEDENYGRLIKPCQCRGGMRYIHEHCLLRLRTESTRPGSLWKCHQCGHQFSFRRLALQRYLGSKVVSGILAVVCMLIVMFLLGFVADPVLDLYLGPYDNLVGYDYYWDEPESYQVIEEEEVDAASGWGAHFLKGMISMGVVGLLKTALLNPLHWWNLRISSWSGGRSRGRMMTGRSRTANISWLAVLIGILSAFWFFYKWTQKVINMTLQRIGNNIVDTQLPGDDDDLKPPPGFRFTDPGLERDQASSTDPVGESVADDAEQTSEESRTEIRDQTPSLRKRSTLSPQAQADNHFSGEEH
ncbi:hypothetical protein DV738_g4663, partial [Chaetothyriales sp. CBS 135597]